MGLQARRDAQHRCGTPIRCGLLGVCPSATALLGYICELATHLSCKPSASWSPGLQALSSPDLRSFSIPDAAALTHRNHFPNVHGGL